MEKNIKFINFDKLMEMIKEKLIVEMSEIKYYKSELTWDEFNSSSFHDEIDSETLKSISCCWHLLTIVLLISSYIFSKEPFFNTIANLVSSTFKGFTPIVLTIYSYMGFKFRIWDPIIYILIMTLRGIKDIISFVYNDFKQKKILFYKTQNEKHKRIMSLLKKKISDVDVLQQSFKIVIQKRFGERFFSKDEVDRFYQIIKNNDLVTSLYLLYDDKLECLEHMTEIQKQELSDELCVAIRQINIRQEELRKKQIAIQQQPNGRIRRVDRLQTEYYYEIFGELDKKIMCRQRKCSN